MRINEYNSLDEFIYEYDSGRRPSTETQGRKFMGIEFLYRGIYYRMCYEPAENEGEPRFYYVYVMHCEFLIGGIPFKDVIMNDNTEILSQD